MAANHQADAYDTLHKGLDHALLCLAVDEEATSAMQVDTKRLTTSPFEAWHAVQVVAANRYEMVSQKIAQRDARRLLKQQAAKAEAKDEEEKKQRPKPVKVKKEETTKKAKEKTKPKAEVESIPVVKMLDLSGANLSPVMTHVKSSPRVSENIDSSILSEPTKASAREPKNSGPLDVLTRLRRLPLLEDVEPASTKYKTVVKWLEHDDGQNKRVSADLASLVTKLQKNGTIARTSGRASPRRLLNLGTETLNDLLKLEAKSKKAVKNGVKKEPKRRKTAGSADTHGKSRKRRLGAFVVDSDEEEYEFAGGERDSEDEYVSDGDASSSDDGIDLEMEVDPTKVAGSEGVVKKERIQPARTVNGGSTTSPQTATPPASSKASPRSASSDEQLPLAVASSPSTGKEQLARVAAKLRELDKHEDSSATPTYLSYNQSQAPQPIPVVAPIKREEVVVVPSTGSSIKEGSSESNAIVLDDSDDDDEEEAIQDVILQPREPPKPVPASPKPQPKQQRAPSPKQSKPASKTPPKSAGKSKATTPSTSKRKNVVESDDDSDAEAEFVAPGEDEDSSTDADEDMFDLNEEDVFVVETILEVKKGRTLMTNSGRYTKDPDLFLVKWEGYDELTWEPEANIPKRIISFFNEREIHKRNCGYQIESFHQRKVAKNSTTGKDEILYLIQWKGLSQPSWEVKATLPQKTHIWLEKTSRASLNKANLSGPSPRKKGKK